MDSEKYIGENVILGQLSRRRLLVRLALVSATAGVASCGGAGAGAKCLDEKLLTAGQRAARAGRKYQEASPFADMSCSNCSFFRSAASACGTCAIDGQAANPAGYCTSWSAQTASLQDLMSNKGEA